VVGGNAECFGDERFDYHDPDALHDGRTCVNNTGSACPDNAESADDSDYCPSGAKVSAHHAAHVAAHHPAKTTSNCPPNHSHNERQHLGL
jgi:hypothetical protein